MNYVVSLGAIGNDPAKKTICIYGHLDVQPAAKVSPDEESFRHPSPCVLVLELVLICMHQVYLFLFNNKDYPMPGYLL